MSVLTIETSAWQSPAPQENSEVSPEGLVAVAVTAAPGASVPAKIAVKGALPSLPVVTSLEPRRVWPSPCAVGSAAGLEKNSRR